MFSKRIITLNIEADSVRVLAVKGKTVEKWGSASLEPGVVKDGLVLQPEVLSKAIDKLFADLKLPRKRAVVSVTGLRATFRIITLPQVKPALLEESIRWEAKAQMPVSLEELYLSWQVIGSRESEQDIFVLGMPREVVDAQMSALANAGIKGRVLDFKPLALARVAGCRDAIVLNLEPDSYEIALIADGIPVVTRTVTPKSEGAVLEDNLWRLSEEIGRIVEYYNREHPMCSIAPDIPVFSMGSLANDSGTADAIVNGIGFPVEPLKIPVKYPADFPVATYAVNLGLAYRGRVPKLFAEKSNARPRDIAPSVLPLIRVQPLPIRYALLGVIALLVVGGAYPVYQTTSDAQAKTDDIQIEMDELSAQLQGINRAVEAQQSVENTIKKLETEAEGLESEIEVVTSSGSDYGEIAGILIDSLPDGTQLTSLELDQTQIVLNGSAESPSAVIDYARTLENDGVFGRVFISNLGKSFTINIDR